MTVAGAQIEVIPNEDAKALLIEKIQEYLEENEIVLK